MITNSLIAGIYLLTLELQPMVHNTKDVLSAIRYPLNAIEYTHDNIGNRLTKTNTDGTHTYAYDSTYRLLTADNPDAIGDESYSYDSVGNRLTSYGSGSSDPYSYSYNSGNQLTDYDSTTFTFDNNGNTTTKADTTGTTTYTWDYENRLTSAVTPSNTVTFSYDPFGKRISKTVDGVTTYYLYDNEDIVAEYDNTGTLLRSYIHGQGIDESLRITNAATSADHYYLSDGLESITEIQDNTGTAIEKYSYDSFGNVTIKDGAGNVLTESAIGNFYMFTGREWEKETGLYFYRARYYDSTMGRFLSEDPILKKNINYFRYNLPLPIYFMPKLFNAFIYCYNLPTFSTDPYGLLADFDWWDFTSWNSTNYCGASKIGPGNVTSGIDKCCKEHDECLKKANQPWWKLMCDSVEKCHKTLNKCVSRAVAEAIKEVGKDAWKNFKDGFSF